jgi:hypothetical protein
MKVKLKLIKWQILLYIGLLFFMIIDYVTPETTRDSHFIIMMIILSLPTLLGGVLSTLLSKGQTQISIAYLITLFATSPFFFYISEAIEELWLHLDLMFRTLLFVVYSTITHKTINNQHENDLSIINYSKLIKLSAISIITIILCYINFYYINFFQKSEIIIKSFDNIRNCTCLVSIMLLIYFLLKRKDKWTLYSFVVLLLLSTIDIWYNNIYNNYTGVCFWIVSSIVIYVITYLNRNSTCNTNLSIFCIDFIYILIAFGIISLVFNYNHNLLILSEAFTLWVILLLSDKHFALKSLILFFILIVDFVLIQFQWNSSHLFDNEFIVKYGSIATITTLGYLLIHASVIAELKEKTNIL